jgi:hypothetical protein
MMGDAAEHDRQRQERLHQVGVRVG